MDLLGGKGEKGKLGVETRQEREEGWREWGQLQNQDTRCHVGETRHSEISETHLIQSRTRRADELLELSNAPVHLCNIPHLGGLRLRR